MTSPEPGYLALESASKLLLQAVEQVRAAHYASLEVGRSALNGAGALEDVANAMSVLAQADKWEYDQHDHSACEHVGGGRHPDAVCECGCSLSNHFHGRICQVCFDHSKTCSGFRWEQLEPLSPGVAHTGQS